jgi:DNA-binding NarL/FixJ family response regulator
MTKYQKTHIYCYDDHRGFSEDIRKRFTDAARYTVVSYPTREEFIDQIRKAKENKFCKIAILGLHDSPEQLEMISHLTMEVKKIDPATGLILICPQDKIELIRKTIKFNIDAYIPKNSNSILRIHNTVKKLISEHSIGIFRRKMNLSIYVLLGFLLIVIGSVIFGLIKFPQYF